MLALVMDLHMGEDSKLSGVGFKATGFAAEHPRAVLMMVFLLVLIATQGSAAAEVDLSSLDLATTSGEGTVDPGP